MTTPMLLVMVAVIALAGVLNGLAGFGFALVGTMILAVAIDPELAVVVMIIPIVAVNLSLVRELSWSQLRACGRRFWPLIVAALVGTALGMLVIERLPAAPLRVGLGMVTLGFVVSTIGSGSVPVSVRKWTGGIAELPSAMVAIGGLSGVLFGGTNVGVQFVAYLRSRRLDHGLFVGVVAMVFLGLNVLRVGLAGALGLYPDWLIVLASIAAAVPAVAGVWVGTHLRDRVSDRTVRWLVLAVLTVIGIRLVVGGVGLV